jgi:Undecaprenyl-phosphate glucose phosphotransferase
MVKFHARLMIGALVAVDVLATALAWVLAYELRFNSDLVAAALPVTKGVPELSRYLLLLPVIVLLWPPVLYFHGLYQVTRSRSGLDELFPILRGVLGAAALTLGLALYVRVYHLYQPDVAPLWEFSQAVFGLFVALDVAALSAGRAALRAWLRRRWAAGWNVRRLLIAGAGELGRQVAEALHGHRALGYRVVGFLDDEQAGPVAGLPVLGRLAEAGEILVSQSVDQLYVALPLEQHARMVELVKTARNEGRDVKVVPDLVQYAAIKATLEDLDGIPIISLNEVPLSGWNSLLKRSMDVVLGGALLLFFSTLVPVFPVVAFLVWRRGGPGPILLRQERMTMDGRTFQIFKFRTMVDGAEKETGPVFASEDDPRRTAIGTFLRRYNLDEFPQLLNVVLGDMSLVGPRPERPPFVQQFKQHIPQYMVRHRVKSGMTGWAQINGWRGNTSIEKRIECDLYYIENWTLLLDVKILILTLFRGFGQKHAY